jgi:uncharacterized protein YjiS (DUF1127 family)
MDEGTGTLNPHRYRGHAGFSLFEVIGTLIAAAAGKLWAWVSARMEAARMAAVRRELHRMSDHYLRDIGLSRTDIDRMFR